MLLLRGLSSSGEKVKEVSSYYLDKKATRKNPVFIVKKYGMPNAPYLVRTNFDKLMNQARPRCAAI